MKTLRDLLIEEQGALVTDSFQKGNSLRVGGKQYIVTSRTKAHIRLKREDGQNYRILVFNSQFVAFSSNRKKNPAAQLFRDIEADITVDLINESNPFHAFSDSYNIAIQELSKIQ